MNSIIRTLFLLGVSCYASTALAAPTFNIVRLGLADPEHTRNDGYEYGSAIQMNESGQVRGYSSRYNGGSTDLGQSAWLYNGTTSINIGLTDLEHTRNDGYKYSVSYGSGYSELNESGQVSGMSDRFNGGSTDLGQSTWLYDGTKTINIGMTDPAHTRNDGYKFSRSYFFNESGQVTGQSQLFNGGTSMGYSAWLYNGATTIDLTLTSPEYTRSDGYRASGAYDLSESGYVQGSSQRYKAGRSGVNADLGNSQWVYDGTNTKIIGLVGGEFTRNDGYRISFAGKMNQSGQVYGYAYRYYGTSSLMGAGAWLYNGVTTLDIALNDTAHTRNDGFKDSRSEGMNEAGQVRGYSHRYSGSTWLGQTAWLYNGTTTVDIGLVDPEHTRNDGYKYSGAELLNEAGEVSGYSYRYSGSTFLGPSAWLYNGSTTRDIGLIGPEHTRNDGRKESFADDLSQTGKVIGHSYRFNGGSADLGQSAWLFNGATTLNIGLTSPSYTRNDGYKFSLAEELNDSGQAAGHSNRYNGGGTQLGQDAWFYDSTLAQTISLSLSIRSDGYAYSYIEYLGEDGLALGEYSLFDGLNHDLGLHAFYFTIADGLRDLGSLINVGLAANGWQSLAEAIRANDQGRILGHGKLTSQSGGQMAYLLMSVPEPSTLYLATYGATGWLSRRRRQHRIGHRNCESLMRDKFIFPTNLNRGQSDNSRYTNPSKLGIAACTSGACLVRYLSSS
jgi:hypothetical protein